MVAAAKKYTLIAHYPQSIEALSEKILRTAKLPPLSKDDDFALKLSFAEAINNAFVHGNKRDPKKKVFIEYSFNEELFEIEITDEGSGFDDKKIPNPIEDKNLNKDSGRGLLIMQHYMDKVCHNNKGNKLYMNKQIKAAQ